MTSWEKEILGLNVDGSPMFCEGERESVVLVGIRGMYLYSLREWVKKNSLFPKRRVFITFLN